MNTFCFLFFQIFAGVSLHAQTVLTRDSILKMMADHNFDTAHTKLEIESEFPGGQTGWVRFLNSHLAYPAKAVRKKVEGTVWLQFIVEKDGSINDIQATSGPELLLEAAVNVIKESPKWIPAIQNNKKVKSYKKQPITFRLQ